VQRDALDLSIRFFDSVSAFRPILADWDPEHLNKGVPKQLRLTGQEAFHELKALYVDAYEVTCRALTLVTALINVNRRNDHNAYPPHPRLKARFQAKSMAEFNEMNNAPKLELLAEEPFFQSWLGGALDPKLRNAVGHNTISYDFPTGTIKYQLGRPSSTSSTKTTADITYAEFLSRTLRAVVRAHEINHLVKILDVMTYYVP
jgi:hypothetical protein